MRLLPILFVNDNPIAAVSVLFNRHVFRDSPSTKIEERLDEILLALYKASEDVRIERLRREEAAIASEDPIFGVRKHGESNDQKEIKTLYSTWQLGYKHI